MPLAPKRGSKAPQVPRRTSKADHGKRATRSQTSDAHSGPIQHARPATASSSSSTSGGGGSAPKAADVHRPRRSSGASGAPFSAAADPPTRHKPSQLDTQSALGQTERHRNLTTRTTADDAASRGNALRQLWAEHPKRVILGIGAAVGLLGVLLLLASLQVSDRVFTRTVCRKPRCVEYARLLNDTLNTSVDPCHSFTQFVCHGWHRRHRLRLSENIVRQAITEITQGSTALPKTGQDNAQRGLALYRSCDAVVHGKVDHLAGVREALKEAGITWPSPPPNVDIPRAIVATSLKLGWDVMFRVVALWRQPSPKTSGTVLLNVGRTIIDILNKTFYSTNPLGRRSYFDMLCTQLDNTSKACSGNALFDEVSSVENESVTLLRRAYYKPEVMPPAEVRDIWDDSKPGLSRAKWAEAFRKFGLNDAEPPSQLQFLSVNPDYVDTFKDIWQKKLGDARMHLFISWCTVQVGALFANKHLASNFYGGDHETAKVLHAAFCLSRAFSVSGRHLFTKYNLGHAPVLKDARHMAGLVRSSLQRRLRRWTSRHNQTYVDVVANWSSLEAPFGLLHGSGQPVNWKPARGDNAWSGGGSGEFDKMFPDLDETSFLSNLRNTSSAVAVASGEYDTESDVEVTAVAAALSILQLSAPLYGLPDLQLMPYVLAFPLFDNEQLPAVNFGGLGLEVARALGVLALKAYRNYGPLASGGEIRSCFRRSIHSHTADTSLFIGLGEALGMGALVDAYGESSRDDERFRLQLPGFEQYTGPQMLFIATCLLKCSGSDTGATPNSVCDLSLAQVREFWREFNCVSNTTMHPSIPCDVF